MATKCQQTYQLAIINPKVQDNYLVSEDTVTIHPFFMNDLTFSSSAFPKIVDLKSVSLIDDPTIQCKLELVYHKYYNAIVSILFMTEVPPAYEYTITLYYVNKAAKLDYVKALNVKNVRKNDKFAISFERTVLSYDSAFAPGIFAFCIKIRRNDILANINKKPALLMPTQITDCSLLFENTALTNCMIIVGDREFRVHKEILAAKSPVFLTMFETEMKEKKENKVTIDDIEAEIFQEFLRYIYTNVVNEINSQAEKLLIVAEKYDVPKLKLICSDELSRSLAVENPVHILMVADSYGIKCLKDRALGVIRNNVNVIINTEEYKALYKSEQVHLIHEIMKLLVKSGV